MELQYPILGKIDEDRGGAWIAKCGCSGYIDENYDAVIGHSCKIHKRLKRIKWKNEGG